MVNIFDKIFDQYNNNSDKEEISSRDIKISILGAERETRKSKQNIRKIKTKRENLISKIKTARRNGNNDDVNDFYQEFQDLKTEETLAKRDQQVLNLEIRVMKKTLRTVEWLEKTSNKGRIRDLIQRIQKSGLHEKLQAGSIDEEAYLDELGLVMEDVQTELEDLSPIGNQENAEKASFLAELDEIIAAEEEGSTDIALEKTEELKKLIDPESAQAPEF